MSVIDDARILAQDIVAPDLKALSARMDAVEALLKQGLEAANKRFDIMERRFDAAEQSVAKRFDAAEQSVAKRFDAAEQSAVKRFEAVEQIAALRHETVLSRFDSTIASANANHEATLKALNMEWRMKQLESAVAAQQKERHA